MVVLLGCKIEGCQNKAKPYPSYQGWCGKHYTRWYRHGDPRYAKESHDLMERIMACIEPGDCWEWNGTIHETGYGQTYAQGRFQRAHRVVYELLVGKIPAGLTLDHLCRNKPCVNPDHLEPVTRGENVRRGAARYRTSRDEKGRYA